MTHSSELSGVFAAAVTPLSADYSLDREGLLDLLTFLANRGAHGALLLGSTGEGPAFSQKERVKIFKTGIKIKQEFPDFKLLAGTGTPSLQETIKLTKKAYDIGFDGVVTLPPYYFRSASDEGLFTWYDAILSTAVPEYTAFLAYHIPKNSGVPLSLELLDRLKNAHPTRFAGLKDSSASLDHAIALGTQFKDDLIIMNGTDRLFTDALNAGAKGCITALGNLISPDLRSVWDAYAQGSYNLSAQAVLSHSRDVSERFPPAAPFLKYLLSALHNFPLWSVKPPLLSLSPRTADQALLAWKSRGQVA